MLVTSILTVGAILRLVRMGANYIIFIVSRRCQRHDMLFRAAGEESAPLVFRATAQRQRSQSLALRAQDGMSSGDG